MVVGGFPPECPALFDFPAPLPPRFLSGSWRGATESEGMGTDGKENTTASCLPCPLRSPCHFLFQVCSWWTNHTSVPGYFTAPLHTVLLNVPSPPVAPLPPTSELLHRGPVPFLIFTTTASHKRHLKTFINGKNIYIWSL